jgi:hypothetical protein
MENRARNILVQVMLYTARILMACSSMCVFIYIYIYIMLEVIILRVMLHTPISHYSTYLGGFKNYLKM